MIHHVVVGVALQRPPMIDEFRYYVIEDDSEQVADMIALRMAGRGSVMPVWLGWPEDVEHLPTEWIRK